MTFICILVAFDAPLMGIFSRTRDIIAANFNDMLDKADDPAKMICDFFCQPAVPLPPKWRCRFIESVTTPFSDKQKLLERVQVLLPLYYVKWCCIVLNGCLPEGRARRSFAGAVSQTPADREAGMLERARQLLERVTTPRVEPGEDVFLGKERTWERC